MTLCILKGIGHVTATLSLAELKDRLDPSKAVHFRVTTLPLEVMSVHSIDTRESSVACWFSQRGQQNETALSECPRNHIQLQGFVSEVCCDFEQVNCG
jgi:hypothetical protein